MNPMPPRNNEHPEFNRFCGGQGRPPVSGPRVLARRPGQLPRRVLLNYGDHAVEMGVVEIDLCLFNLLGYDLLFQDADLYGDASLVVLGGATGYRYVLDGRRR